MYLEPSFCCLRDIFTEATFAAFRKDDLPLSNGLLRTQVVVTLLPKTVNVV
jgi:hypothetical protein